MKKYWQIFKISLQNALVYRTSLVLWQTRIMVSFLGIYWLWQSIFSQYSQVAGYNQQSLLVYLLLALFLNSLVFSNLSYNACVEIANGDLNNYLLKPLNYFKTWLARDWSDKILNLAFFGIEIVVLIKLLGLPFALPSNWQTGLAFASVAVLASFLYFFYSFIISAFAFWYPEHDGWPLRFVALTLLEFLAGMAFPLDIFPPALLTLFKALPFYYFVFYPIQVYLGRANAWEMVIMLAWLVLLIFLTKLVWKKGLSIYGAYGR